MAAAVALFPAAQGAGAWSWRRQAACGFCDLGRHDRRAGAVADRRALCTRGSLGNASRGTADDPTHGVAVRAVPRARTADHNSVAAERPDQLKLQLKGFS